ncbi:MAG: UDP-glucose 4-epimerase GalE [Defluviitaleaceae bacterium]|nr:UDP-glucose 4-epimerase GalE [Defluviitaleaceae bacterium]
MKILVTGGAGYIGSTTCTALINSGHEPIILDSLATGNIDFLKDRTHYIGDIANEKLVSEIIEKHEIETCIHFAARIQVEESMQKPFLYYNENVVKSINFFETIKNNGIKNVIFSSSASVYNSKDSFKVDEYSPLKPISPYAKTKMIMELALEDFTNSDFKAITLRYFNPIGACVNGFSGPYAAEPSHLLGKLVNAAVSNKTFEIYGTNWGTIDGTAIRDYIHVQDLANAHILACEKFKEIENNYEVINVGTGTGVTVKEFVNSFIKVNGDIKIKEAPRRAGDAIGAYADCTKAEKLLGFKTVYTIEQGIRDALKWHSTSVSKIKSKTNL